LKRYFEVIRLGGIEMIKVMQSRNLSQRQMIARILMVVILSVAVISIFPTSSFAVTGHNGELEDCDTDGYDDTTGVPVPWYGYDQTAGDPNPVPADWDGVAGSYDPYGTAGHKKTTKSESTESNTNSSNTSTSKNSGSDTTQKPSTLVENVVPLSELAPEVAAIVGVRGKLSVTPSDGTEGVKQYVPGSEIVIKGVDFAGNVDKLDIEIHSENPQKLITVNSKEDGSFEAKVNIPDDLELGTHYILILYDGNPIVKTSIEVVESVVNDSATPLAAAEDKGGFNAGGLILLVALIIVAAGALLGWKAKKGAKAKSDAAA
jgi:hypothetical protein